MDDPYKIEASHKLISKSVPRSRIDRLLLCASTLGDLDIAQHLLEACADPSAVDSDGSTPLHLATENGHEALAQLLADTTAPPSSQ